MIDEALDTYRRALSRAPEDLAALRGLARALQSVRDVEGAIAAWRRVTSLVPDDWEALNDLGAALTESRAWDEASSAFDAARAIAPREPLVVVNRATLDVRRGRSADAIAPLEACVKAHPELAPALLGLALALREEGRLRESAAALRRCIALAPFDAAVACALSRVLLEEGDPSGASEAARDYLLHRPGHAGALAGESLARLALGDAREVARLIDHERLVAVDVLDPPEGFVDLATFNRALSAHVATHPTLLYAPASHATIGALHSGSLLVSPRGPVAHLERALRAAIARYSRKLLEIPDHPFVAGRPRAAFLNLWSVVMERGGHQIPHIHPSSWLSGVYYPEVPEAVRSGDGPGGWLEFGGAERPFPSRLSPRVHGVRPVEGLLVLFPSYFYHRTIPFEAPGRRISVAFDLMPA